MGKKRLLFISVSCIIGVLWLVVVLNYKTFMGKRPCDQPESKWISEDKTIRFEMLPLEESSGGTGEMLVQGKTVEFYFTNDTGAGIYLYNIDVAHTHMLTSEAEYEYWMGSFRSKNEFTATVKRTTYFEVGKTIKFHRVDD